MIYSDYFILEEMKARAVKQKNYVLASKIRDTQKCLKQHLNQKWTDEILNSIEKT